MHRLSARMALASALVALVITVVLTVLIVAIRDQRDTARQAQRASELVDAARAVRTSLVDLQSGTRGHLISRRAPSLPPFPPARSPRPAETATLEDLAAAAPASRRVGVALVRRSRTY